MTEAIYLEVTEKAEAAHKAKRRVSVSGMLKILGVSRSGYRAWLKHVPSNAEKRRESVKAKISPVLQCSITNKRLAAAGYFSILSYYESLHLCG